MPIKLDRDAVALLKRSLRTIWPSVKSSHADEAIAAYYGFRTHAALLSALPKPESRYDVELNVDALMSRLDAFGYRLPVAEFERVSRLFTAEMMGRINKNFRSMKDQTANDNRTS